MFDIKSVKQEAAKELADERAKKAKELIKAKLRQRELAQQVVANVDREIADLEVAIANGTF